MKELIEYDSTIFDQLKSRVGPQRWMLIFSSPYGNPAVVLSKEEAAKLGLNKKKVNDE